jgi:hypothetical protein
MHAFNPKTLHKFCFTEKILEIKLTKIKRLIKKESLESFSWRGSLRFKVSSQLSWKRRQIFWFWWKGIARLGSQVDRVKDKDQGFG